MEYRNQGDEIGMQNSTLGYNPPPGRGSAFSKPTFSTSSSLLSPRAAAAAGGAASAAGGGGIGGNRNGHIIANTTPPPPLPHPSPPASAATTTAAILTHISTSIDNHSSSSQSFGNLISDPAPVSNSSQSTPAAGAGGILSNSKPSTAAPVAKASTTNAAAADVSCRYRECLRNHAASVGGHVVDGCGEFMPNGDPSTHEFLKCAACGCHRSFHRKEPDAGESNAIGSAKSYYRNSRLPLLLPPPHPQSPHGQKHFHLGSGGAGFPPSPSPRAAAPAGSSVVMAFGGNTSGSGGTTESSSEERFHHVGAAPAPATAGSRKRFRTKFTPEQKEKMLAFAERIGWRIQKQDEAAVQQFCSDAGVRRQVLKVWMHNNKNTIKKQEQQRPEHDQLFPQRHHDQQQQQP